ncbi:MAG: hypothetical protein WC972_07475, partial [Trueperaceae bacterium]
MQTATRGLESGSQPGSGPTEVPAGTVAPADTADPSGTAAPAGASVAPTKIACRNLTKVFGGRPERVLEFLERGGTKEEAQAR